jgi:hypothetical protein
MKLRGLCVTWAAMLIVGGSAFACGFHGIFGGAWTIMQPGSIEVAVAVRESADRGELDSTWLEVKKDDPLGFARVSLLLRRSRAPLEALATSNSVALLLVESGLWSRFVRNGESVRVETHVVGPSEGDAVIVTSAAVLDRVVQSRLAVPDAVKAGWMILSNPQDRTP